MTTHRSGPGPTAVLTWRRWAPPATVVDVALFVVVAGLGVAMLTTGGEVDARAPDAVGAVLLVIAALPLCARRQWPLVAFTIQLGIVLLYLSLDYSGGAELPAILAGVYSVAVAGHRWWTLSLVVAFVGVGSVYRVAVEAEDALTVTIGGSLLLLVALLGDGVHARRQLRVEIRRRLAVAEAEKESEARARVAEERLRIAHELHDVMAHTITAMTVQAGAASDQLDRDPERARVALDSVRGAARDAMAELRTVIGVLRAPGADTDRGPAPQLDRLPELVRTTEQAGIAVDLDADVTRPLGPAVEVAAFRIVQEALTNVVRHAGASRATVRLRVEGTTLEVEVRDDGRGPSAPPTADGFGLVGLRERAAAVGGSPRGRCRPRRRVPRARPTADRPGGRRCPLMAGLSACSWPTTRPWCARGSGWCWRTEARSRSWGRPRTVRRPSTRPGGCAPTSS